MDVLSIPTVLQTVFKNLDTRHAAAYRLVNKDWNYEACKMLRDRVVITFNTHEDLKKYNEDFNKGTTVEFANISIRFQSFYFQSNLFIKAIEDIAFGNLRRLQQDIRKFAQVSGDQVVRLQLCICPVLELPNAQFFTFPSSQTTNFMYTEMVEMVYSHFPNLKHLKLLFLISSINPLQEQQSSNDDVRDFQLELDSHAGQRLPNLRTLYIDIVLSHNNLVDFGGFDDMGNDEVRSPGLEKKMIGNFLHSLLSSASNLEEVSSKPPPLSAFEPLLHQCLLLGLPLISPSSYLKHINLPLRITGEDLHSFCSFAFPNLETFIFEIDSNTVTNSGLNELFTCYHHSLRKLYLDFGSSSQSDYFIQLHFGASMKRLETITLQGYRGCFDWGKLPVLKHLTLGNCSLEGFASSLISNHALNYTRSCKCPPKSDCPCMCPVITPLDTLEIFKGTTEKNEPFSKAFIHVAPYCFPHLTSLSVSNLSATMSFPIIFKECKQLKNLVIQNCSEVNDEILCGVRMSLLSKICPVELMHNKMEKNLESVQKLVALAKRPSQASFRESPFIGDLKGLQSVTLEGEFTDVSVLYGIIHCERLQVLKLRSMFCTWRTARIIKVSLYDVMMATINGKRLDQLIVP